MLRISTAAPYGVSYSMLGGILAILSGCGGSGGGGGGDNTPSFEADILTSRVAFIGDGEIATAIINGYPLTATYETDSNNITTPRFYFEPQAGDESLFTNPELWGRNAETWFASAYFIEENVVCVDAPGYPTHINAVSGDIAGTFTFRECQTGEIDVSTLSDNWTPVYMEDFTGTQAVQNAVLDNDGNVETWILGAAVDAQGDVLLYMDNPNAAYTQEALMDFDSNTLCANFLSLASGAIIHIVADTQAPPPLTTEGLDQFAPGGTLTDVTLFNDCTYNSADWQ